MVDRSGEKDGVTGSGRVQGSLDGLTGADDDFGCRTNDRAKSGQDHHGEHRSAGHQFAFQQCPLFWGEFDSTHTENDSWKCRTLGAGGRAEAQES